MKLSFKELPIICVLAYNLYLHFVLYKLQGKYDSLAEKVRKLTEIKQDKSPAPKASPIVNRTVVIGNIYGGNIDPDHLGGFIQQDNNTISPNAWNHMLGPWAVRSVIDLGCGRGFSSAYFREHGAKVLCVEGSRDAVRQSLLPKSVIVNHDITLGPWWPEETFDALWCTEFLEHVARPFMPNYIPLLRKAAIIMMTQPGWGGHHHVEVHGPNWWIERMEMQGFQYSPLLTQEISNAAKPEIPLRAQAIHFGMKVFINSAVASLPKHRHLIGGHGCYSGQIDSRDGGRPCIGVDSLPLQYQSLLNCKKELKDVKDDKWEEALWTCERNYNLTRFLKNEESDLSNNNNLRSSSIHHRL